jgi:hypothetical protein
MRIRCLSQRGESGAATLRPMAQAHSGHASENSRKRLNIHSFPLRPFIPPIHSQTQYVVCSENFVARP